ncbi:hypothetical protein NJI34_35720 [Pseudomonas sp. S 311-6]|uniref:hypothetical protein n=1 Tax=Kerstersia gyiorum TaxID=206506 RepID=UPI002096E0B5|nr:hypothetical protein [Pseudomonas sp. S 311-6]
MLRISGSHASVASAHAGIQKKTAASHSQVGHAANQRMTPRSHANGPAANAPLIMACPGDKARKHIAHGWNGKRHGYRHTRAEQEKSWDQKTEFQENASNHTGQSENGALQA